MPRIFDTDVSTPLMLTGAFGVLSISSGLWNQISLGWAPEYRGNGWFSYDDHLDFERSVISAGMWSRTLKGAALIYITTQLFTNRQSILNWAEENPVALQLKW